MTDAHKTQVQAQFGPSAEAYVKSQGHAAGDDLEWLLYRGRQRGAARVLDMGARQICEMSSPGPRTRRR